MIASYHNHTYRCHHATGTERQYIEKALEGGIKYMGFSDHIPCPPPEGQIEDFYRVSMDDRFAYAKSVLALKEEFKDRIDIKLGFEAEYSPALIGKMLEVCREIGAEYLILGQHFVGEWYNSQENVSATMRSSVEFLDSYVDSVCEGMRTGYFTYVAHPDVVNFSGDKEIYLEKMRKICETSLDTGIPLELNFLGLRENRHYPNFDFWEMVGKMGCKVVYAFDAHARKDAFDGKTLKLAEEIREKYGLNVIEVPKIIDIRKLSIKNA